MAKQKTIWIDDAGQAWDTQAQAERSDLCHAAEEAFEKITGDGICFQGLDGVNHEALEPIKKYIDQLTAESIERTEKFG